MQADVAVIGAGPIGCAVAAELQRRGRSVCVYDRGPIGQTISWFPNQMRFNSSARNLELLGLPVPARDGEKPTREEYLAYLRDFVRYFELDVHTYEEVTSIEGQRGSFQLTTRKRSGQRRDCVAKRVVLAIGGNEVPRELGIPGEDLPHVSHYFRDPHTYHGQRVLIVGGRNSAAEAAIRLAHLGSEVTLVHRHPEIETKYLKYWIAPEFEGMIRRGSIKAHLGCLLQEIRPDAITVRDAEGRSLDIPEDFVLLLIGYLPDYTLIDQLGIPTEHTQRQPQVDPETLETPTPGVFCAGTIVAGDQNPYRVFIENALDHPRKIADAIEAQDGQER